MLFMEVSVFSLCFGSQGRVNTREVFGLPNSDLVPGVYEGKLILLDMVHVICIISFRLIGFDKGGLKLWEGSIDLVKALEKETQTGNISFPGKRVLEVTSLLLDPVFEDKDI